MDIIHLLPDTVANQIAAGEVVQRPSSVLKELVENSLDAGARHINIVILDAGRTLLQVIDDGKGMSANDARMAFERHATSKISSAEDLFNLHTMGFRGEALASIAAVSQVSLTTRRAEDELGTKLEMAGANVIEQDYCQCPVGTSIAVKNLFFNTPARRRFMKTNATELKNLYIDFYRIALVYPGVHFTFESNGERVYDLEPCTTRQRIVQLLAKIGKRDFNDQLLTVDTDTEFISIRGYVSKPESAQKNAYQYLFVNGRYMRHPYFHKAIINAYQGLLGSDCQPHYFIYFTIAAHDIDVNIHPTKTEIKFADEQAIWPLLYAAVRETLGKFDARPSIDFDQTDAPQFPVLDNAQKSRLHIPGTGYSGYNPFENPAQGRDMTCQPSDNGQQTTDWRQDANLSNWQKLYEGFESQGQGGNKEQGTRDNSQDSFGSDAVALIDQVAGKWLLCKTDGGLLLIDQHRAHTRVLYDTMQAARMHSGTIHASQQLLFPDLWQLNADTAAVVRSMLDDIKSLGFELQKFGTTAFSVTAVPAELGDNSPIEALNDILASTGGESARMTRDEAMTLALANASAVRSGKTLTQEQMQQLLQDWMQCPQKAITPDGKPVLTAISYDEIARRF